MRRLRFAERTAQASALKETMLGEGLPRSNGATATVLGVYGCNLPRYPSACGNRLERARPQCFARTRFDLMGPRMRGGGLDGTRERIMAHERQEAFVANDARQVMQALADFAATRREAVDSPSPAGTGECRSGAAGVIWPIRLTIHLGTRVDQCFVSWQCRITLAPTRGR